MVYPQRFYNFHPGIYILQLENTLQNQKYQNQNTDVATATITQSIQASNTV